MMEFWLASPMRRWKFISASEVIAYAVHIGVHGVKLGFDLPRSARPLPVSAAALAASTSIILRASSSSMIVPPQVARLSPSMRPKLAPVLVVRKVPSPTRDSSRPDRFQHF